MPDLDYDETPDRLKEFIESTADALETDTPPERVAAQIKAGYGFDVSEVSEKDANTFVDAIEDGDLDGACEILEDYDASDGAIERFRNEVGSMVAGNSDADAGGAEPADTASDPTGNGQQPPQQNTGPPAAQGVSEQEVRQIVRSEVQSAIQDAVNQSGGGGEASGQDQLAQLVSLAQLATGGGGGGEMAELGQQFQRAAMNSFIKEMQKPSVGDMMEAKMFEDMAEEYADQYKKEMFGDPFENMDDMDDLESDDDDSGGLLQWMGS